MKNYYYDIALEIPLRHCFTYKSTKKIKNGTRVRVPFSNKILIGIIVKRLLKPDDCLKLNTIKDILSYEDHVCFEKNIFDITLWASSYYHHPIGEVLFTFVPNLLRKNNKKNIAPTNDTSHYETSSDNKTLKLTKDQTNVINKIKKQKGFRPTLIHGVTGSGKTEIYLRLAEEYIKQKKSVLILVPEINLIPQLESRFKKRFKGEIGIYNSRLTPTQRLKVWLKSKFGEIKIVIGTRSSVLVPLQDLGLIVVDEEHDQSYKQSEGFKFSGRDIAIKRAQLQKIPIVLGSATPSLQTLKNVEEKKYQQYSLLKRVDGSKPPKIIPFDIKESKLIGGLALSTIEVIEKVIQKGEQVLIFINRRGFAPVYECNDCGWVANCNSCSKRLVFHKSKNRLICHECNSVYGVNDVCPDCNSHNINLYGYGTERVAEVLQNIFTKTPIIKFDYDSTRLKGSLEDIYKSIHEHNEAILVGTQMLSKGHDFPNVTLCIILNVDHALSESSYFNSFEKISQQLIQVSGRAGRNNNSAKVMLQTRNANMAVLQRIKSGDYISSAMNELQNLKQLKLPPYSALCVLRVSAPKSESCIKFLKRSNVILSSRKDVDIFGPLPSIPYKSKGNSRYHLIIKSPTKKYLNKILNFLIKEFVNWPETRKVKWSVDIDPHELS